MGRGPSAVSQPGISPARRPVSPCPAARQFHGPPGGWRRRQAAAVGPARRPRPAACVPGPADGGVTGAGAADSTSDGPDWTVLPVPTSPRLRQAPGPAANPSLPNAGQPERGRFRGRSDLRIPARPVPLPGVPTRLMPGHPAAARPGLPSRRETTPRTSPVRPGGRPGTVAAPPTAARRGAASPGRGKAGGGGEPEVGSTQPKTGVPPWEITDSFLAVPPAGASATPASGPAAASQPSGSGTWGSGPRRPARQQPARHGPVGQRPGGGQPRRPTPPRHGPRGTSESPAAASQPSNPRGTDTGADPADRAVELPRRGLRRGRGPSPVKPGRQHREFPGSAAACEWRTRSACSARTGEPTTGLPRAARTDQRHTG